MSLNFDLREIPEETRTILAEDDDRMAGIKKGDRIMSPVTNALIWATMGIGIGILNDDTIPEFSARLDLWQRLNGDLLTTYDAETETWGTRPITAEDVQAHKGLKTNVFPMERRASWLKRTVEQFLFRNVPQPKYR